MTERHMVIISIAILAFSILLFGIATAYTVQVFESRISVLEQNNSTD